MFNFNHICYGETAREGASTPITSLTTMPMEGIMANDQLQHDCVDSQQPVTCRKCSEQKPLAGFYTYNVAKNGMTGECKDCVKARVRNRARSNPSVQAYDRERAKLPHRRDNAARVSKRWREENPLGYKAHTAVGNAVRDGRLAKLPCMFCSSIDVHAHHRDYSKPLEVIWLCAKCHHRLHAAFPETEGENKREGRI